jgi:hypothetical protein
MIASGDGTGVAFEGDERKATRLAKSRAALGTIIAKYRSLFIGVVLHLHFFSSFLQEN